MESNLPFQAIDHLSSTIWFILVCLSIFLNLIVDCDISISRGILKRLRSWFALETFNKLRQSFVKKHKVKKYEEIETIDNRDEDISKYNELSRSIIGSLNSLDKENEICNTSFNSNSKHSSPLIKRKIANSSSTKIDFPSTPTSSSRCSTPKCSTSSQCSTPRLNQRDRLDRLEYLSQSSTPNSLLKNVVIQNARYSSNKNRF